MSNIVKRTHRKIARILVLLRGPSALLLFMLLLSGGASAQKTPELTYWLQFNGPIGSAAQKGIESALRAQDLEIIVSVARGHEQAKAKSHVQIDQEALNTALAPLGIQVVLILVAHDGAEAERMAVADFFSSFPQHINTGDPALDDANYATAKAAWIAAHPEAYQKMLLTNGGQPAGSDQ